MDKREEILQKYQEFKRYLDSIDLEKLGQQYSRTELNALTEQLREVKIRSLGYEIGNLTKEMKKSEFPELLGIHHFPVLKEINFLSEKEKLELDKHLINFRPGHYVQTLWRVINNSEQQKELTQFLIKKGVVEERHVVICPNGCDTHLSNYLTTEERAELEELMKNSNSSNSDYNKFIEEICDECFYEFEPSISNYKVKTYLKMIMERDKRLDNV